MDKIDKAFETMIANLHKNTGKSLEEWITIVQKENFAKHGEIVKFLKEKHSLTHGFANLIGHRSKSSDAASAPNKDNLIIDQYKGKETLMPIYECLSAKILSLGKDIEIAPKKANVSFRRSKQFVLIGPATKTRFEVGLFIKDIEPTERLKAEKPNTMCSHKVSLTHIDEIDEELMNWITQSYINAK